LLPREAVRRIGRKLEGAAIEGRRAIERESGGGLSGRKSRLGRSGHAVTGSPVVRVERLGVVHPSGDKRSHQTAVDPALVIWRQQRRQVFPDAVVIDLDSL